MKPVKESEGDPSFFLDIGAVLFQGVCSVHPEFHENMEDVYWLFKLDEMI